MEPCQLQGQSNGRRRFHGPDPQAPAFRRTRDDLESLFLEGQQSLGVVKKFRAGRGQCKALARPYEKFDSHLCFKLLNARRHVGRNPAKVRSRLRDAQIGRHSTKNSERFEVHDVLI